MHNIIETGKTVIQKLGNTYCPDAIIAGGWVREQIFNFPDKIKDIDIWTTHRISKDNLLELFPELENFQMFTTRIDPRLFCVFKFSLKGIDIDIMFIDPEYIPPDGNITDTFDFNICRCWSLDGEILLGHPTFWSDFNNKTIAYNKTPYNDKNARRIIKNHLPRLIEKFPDYQVVCDSELYELADQYENDPVEGTEDNPSGCT